MLVDATLVVPIATLCDNASYYLILSQDYSTQFDITSALLDTIYTLSEIASPPFGSISTPSDTIRYNLTLLQDHSILFTTISALLDTISILLDII